MKHTVPFHIFKQNLENHLISTKLYDRDWFATQASRINVWWNAGETMEGAKEMIEIFARGHFDTDYHSVTNPFDPKICKPNSPLSIEV